MGHGDPAEVKRHLLVNLFNEAPHPKVVSQQQTLASPSRLRMVISHEELLAYDSLHLVTFLFKNAKSRYAGQI